MKLFLLSVHVVLIGIFCGAAIGVFWTIKRIILSAKATNWPTTTGHLISTQMDGGGRPVIKVKYSYSVENKSYEGNTLGFTYLGCSEEDGGKLLEKLDQLKTLRVYYNPDKPETSTLITQIDPVFAFLFWLVTFLLIFSAMAELALRVDDFDMHEQIISIQ
jgi:hypothetical protein